MKAFISLNCKAFSENQHQINYIFKFTYFKFLHTCKNWLEFLNTVQIINHSVITDKLSLINHDFKECFLKTVCRN
jgi:hypothetical protein